MGQTTDIGWCDSTVNSTSGCDGCELWRKLGEVNVDAALAKAAEEVVRTCYSGVYQETRLSKAMPSLYAADFNEVRLIPGRMAKAAAWSDLAGKDRPDKPWLNGLPRHIFVNDMGDLFGKSVPDEYINDEVIANVRSEKGSRHVWMLLTKRPGRAVSFACDRLGTWPRNVMLGASVTSQAAVKRAVALSCMSGSGLFLSVEPMLSRIEIPRGALRRMSLVIIGAESGPNRRPWNPDWARELADRCQAEGVPVFVKQGSALRPGMQGDLPADLWSIKQFPKPRA